VHIKLLHIIIIMSEAPIGIKSDGLTHYRYQQTKQIFRVMGLGVGTTI